MRDGGGVELRNLDYCVDIPTENWLNFSGIEVHTNKLKALKILLVERDGLNLCVDRFHLVVTCLVSDSQEGGLHLSLLYLPSDGTLLAVLRDEVVEIRYVNYFR